MKRRRARFDESVEDAFRNRHRAIAGAVRGVDPQDRDDVEQDAWIKTLEASRDRVIRSPLAYFRQAARTALIDRFRRRAVRADLEIEVSDQHLRIAVDGGPDPERNVIASDRLRRAMAAIERLPTRRREVFLLARVDGLSYPQIAKRLGISPRTVEHHIHAAMTQISRELDEGDQAGQ